MINPIMIECLVDELREMPDGAEISVYKLVEQCGFDSKELEQNGEMFTVHDKLCSEARKAHIKLDWLPNKDMDIGLPYNIPFIVRNSRAQVKCPRCGSMNTARILYGMPVLDDSLMEKYNSGRIYLGGCCITDFDPYYYCNECNRKFGAKGQYRQEDRMEFFSDIVTELQFYRRIYLQPYQPSYIRIKKTDKGAHVKVRGIKEDIPFDAEYDISNKKWNTLVDTLYYDLYLNDWKHSFYNDDVLDGEEWKLIIKLTDGRMRTYFGMNDFPPYWKEFLKLLRPFCKKHD